MKDPEKVKCLGAAFHSSVGVSQHGVWKEVFRHGETTLGVEVHLGTVFFGKRNLPQLHFTINLMYSQIIDGLLPQNSKNHIFPWPYFYVSFVALEHHLEWTFGIPRVLQAIFRNSILNGKAIEDQYVSSRHKRRPPQIPQSLTLAPIMKKKVGLNSWIWGCEEWDLPWISVLEKVVGALKRHKKNRDCMKFS